ncbi:MAG: FkbM family methyltransferase [Caulobacteraceae bacterium]|nr:FkbM family methyltransferase [Caulobacteraceae bacterium]
MLDVTRAYGLTFLFPRSDSAVGASLQRYGEFARVEVDLISAYLAARPGGTFVDLGANIGAISLPVARDHRGTRVLSVEAHRGLAQILSANALGNGLENIEVFNIGAGARRDIADFPTPSLDQPGNFGTLGFAARDAYSTSPVLMLPLDDLAPADTRLVKVDVEGYELEVLKGAVTTLNDLRPIWLIESSHIHREASRAVMATMKAAGYRIHWFFAPFVLPSHEKKTHETPAERGDYSILALPDGQPNLWDLPEIEDLPEAWPNSRKLFPYFRRYGFE